MVTKIKKRKSASPKKRFIGKPAGQIRRLRAGGRTGTLWHRRGQLRQTSLEMDALELLRQGGRRTDHRRAYQRRAGDDANFLRKACREEGLTDTIVAMEMTGIYHKPVQRAFRKAGKVRVSNAYD